jgi:hypothetical protein
VILVPFALRERLGARADALTQRLEKRRAERQWLPSLTATAFLDDVSRAVRHAGTRLALYHRRGGDIALGLARTASGVPYTRLGDAWLPWLVVVYATDRSAILTGYQAWARDTVSVPEDAVWLT